MLGMIPDANANVVVVADAETTLASPVGAAMLESFSTAAGIDALQTCDVGIERWQTTLVSADSDVDGAIIIFVRAPNAGTDETFTCLAGLRTEPETTRTVDTHAQRPRLHVPEGDARLYSLSDNVVALVGPTWQASYEADATTPSGGRLEDAIGRLNRSASVSFVMMPDARTKARRPNVEATVGAFEAADALAMELAVTYIDAATATEESASLNAVLDKRSMMLKMLGVPATVLDAATVVPKGADATLSMTMTEGEVRQLSAVARNALKLATTTSQPASN